MKKIMTALRIAMLLITSSAYADKFDDGMVAYGKGDYKKVLTLLKPSALQGNAQAQVKLGFMYETGQGELQDYVESVRWYTFA